MALNKIFRPFFVNDLIRIGNRSDGGYIISKKIINLAENVITFGLFDEFSFEKHIKNLKKNIKIICFDHTVGHFFWFRHFCKWIFFSIRYRSFKLFKRSFTFLDYYYFFFKKAQHQKFKIISDIKSKERNETTLTEIINNLKIDTKKNILKIDIDLDEYKILQDILKYEFLCIIIEFSYSNSHMKKIINFIKKNKNMRIIHIHGNNFHGPDKFNNPAHLEITFANKKILKLSKKKSSETYPIKKLDFPCNSLKEDVPIFFKK
jgi:hypothetical protein